MTPVDRLLAAAELLEQRADAALAEADVDDGWVYVYGQSDDCGIYATTVSPEVGKALAAWMRHLALRRSHIVLGDSYALAVADLLLAGES